MNLSLKTPYVMKTKLLLLFLLVSTFVTNAQNKTHDYVPMAIEDAQWVYYNSDDDNMPPWIDYYFGYKIKGDIEINGVWYKKVYYRDYIPINNSGGQATPPCYIGDEYLYGAIRDDIPNKRVYGVQFCENYTNNDCTCNEEFLMYDFNMNIGDYLTDFCLVLDNEYTFINDINDIFFYEKMRDVLSLSHEIGGETIDIIEGIGSYYPNPSSLFGLFNTSGHMFGCPCTSLELYCIGKDEDCLDGFLSLNTNEYKLQNTINLHPNPVKDVLFIDTNNRLSIQSIRFYDILGNLVLDEKSNFQNINITSLTNGLYILKVKSNKGNLTLKIIKG